MPIFVDKSREDCIYLVQIFNPLLGYNLLIKILSVEDETEASGGI